MEERLTSGSSSTVGCAKKVSFINLDYRRERQNDVYTELAADKDRKILNKDKGMIRDNKFSSWKGQWEPRVKSSSYYHESCWKEEHLKAISAMGVWA